MKRPVEYQAVVLVNQSRNLHPITEDIPEALLPVGNKPMIFNVCHWLENAGIQEILVLAPSSMTNPSSAVSGTSSSTANMTSSTNSANILSSSPQTVLPASSSSPSANGNIVNNSNVSSSSTTSRIILKQTSFRNYEGKARIDLVVVDDKDGTLESAQLLSYIKDRISTDVIIVSSNLITDAPLHHLTDSHRINNSDLTCLFFEASKEPEKITSKSSKKGKCSNAGIVNASNDDDMSVVGMDPNCDQILYYAPEVDPEEDLPVKMSLLKPFPHLQLRSDLKDAHCYVMKRWILDELQEKKNVYPALLEDFIPFLIRSQYRPGLLSAKNRQKGLARFGFLKDSSIPVENSDLPLRCGLYVLKSGFCMRVNSFPAYHKANLQAIKQSSTNKSTTDSPSLYEVHGKSQVGSDSRVGEGSVVGDRTSIKRSVIGNHCQIGNNVKITNCIIMDNVRIEDGCRLDNCVVATKVHLKERVSLTNCEVCYQIIVEKELTAKNETLESQENMLLMA